MRQDQHTEWLSLIEVSGPFLAVPVLKEVFPQGLDRLDGDKRKRIRQAYEEWREAKENNDPLFPEIHQAWIQEILCRGLEYDEDGTGDVLKHGDSLPENLRKTFPEHGYTLAPDYVVVNSQKKDEPLLLIQTYPEGSNIDAPIKGDGWVSSPAERMVQLCRAAGCRLGLVTDGERWMLVDAPVGATTTFASWYARLWLQETVTLQAFVSLLGIRRFFLDESERLPTLLDKSLQHQDEVTDALGEQVRRAVEVLIQSLDKADVDRDRELLRDVEPTELYEAGLTVMMRLVFLLCAEERGLLLLGNENYESSYAVSTLRSQLRKESDEILERRWDAWSRLLAIFRCVYGGIEHENLRMPAFGGSLFDPDRFPFLEGRSKGSDWRHDSAAPLPIDNRTVLMLLESIQIFQGRTLSYRALDVEQIGYVYEGLLERTVKPAKEDTLELDATQKAEKPWVTLGELESARLDGEASVIKLLKERTGSAESRVCSDLKKDVSDEQADQLLISCDGDYKLRDRIRPYFHLLRTDPWGYPLVYPKGAFMVTTGTDRRETGTHYTPKSLTEAIVKETLEPVVYIGPAEGKDRADWQLKSPAALLDMKVCDMAMGSGAFLVQVCRWLSERLVEAWHHAEANGKVITIEGRVQDSYGGDEPLPAENEDRLIIARRLIAERCLYGVDMNPLAVELAKLAIWLITLAKERPFGFLDHNLRCGDSLLGIQDLDQLTYLTMQPKKNDTRKLFAQKINDAIQETVDLRKRIRNHPIRDIQDVETMADLDSQARQKLQIPELIADALVGATLKANGKDPDTVSLSIDAQAVMDGNNDKVEELKRRTKKDLSTDLPKGKDPRRPFHWPLEFPEVFLRENGGFDAIIGNPPFIGGQKITGSLGTFYRDYLVQQVSYGTKGAADIVAYFFLVAHNLLRKEGALGLIAVNTIAEGDTRQVGLERLAKQNASIFTAYPNEPWPGSAAVVTSRINIYKGEWKGVFKLSNKEVSHISPFLTAGESWSPKPLEENKEISFIGSYVLGMGFVLTKKEALALIEKNPENKDVLFPYLNGRDLNNEVNQKPSRWVINFWDWPEDKARKYAELYQILEEKVKPERSKKKDKVARERWWLFLRPRPELYHSIGRGHAFTKHPRGWDSSRKPLEKILCITRVSKTVAFAMVSNDLIPSEAIVVFSTDSFGYFALLQSSIHRVFAWQHSSKLKSDLRYSPSDAFETFPFPENNMEKGSLLYKLGESYHEFRREVMQEDGIGLTKFYNKFDDQTETGEKIVELRKLHSEIDQLIIKSYGWDDIDLAHGFHAVPYLPSNNNVCYTISETARAEILMRLGLLNRERHKRELNNKKKIADLTIGDLFSEGEESPKNRAAG